jgi:hypothetical protein
MPRIALDASRGESLKRFVELDWEPSAYVCGQFPESFEGPTSRNDNDTDRVEDGRKDPEKRSEGISEVVAKFRAVE